MLRGRRCAQDRPGDGAEIATGQPVRVPLVEGQSARGLRTAISRAATSHGMTVETVEGDGFVAVKKTDEPRTHKGKQAPATAGPATEAAGAITFPMVRLRWTDRNLVALAAD